jgi:hypothetical protein
MAPCHSEEGTKVRWLTSHPSGSRVRGTLLLSFRMALIRRTSAVGASAEAAEAVTRPRVAAVAMS